MGGVVEEVEQEEGAVEGEGEEDRVGNEGEYTKDAEVV